MSTQSLALRDALLVAESGLREAIAICDPTRESDHAALKDLEEAYGLVAQRLEELESGRWPARPRPLDP